MAAWTKCQELKPSLPITFLRFMTQTVFLVVYDFFWGPDKVSYRPCIIIFIAIVLLVIRIQNNIIQQKIVQLYSKFNAHLFSKFRPQQKQIMIWKARFQDSAQKVLPHLQGNIEIGRHKDRNAEVGNTKHRIY